VREFTARRALARFSPATTRCRMLLLPRTLVVRLTLLLLPCILAQSAGTTAPLVVRLSTSPSAGGAARSSYMAVQQKLTALHDISTVHLRSRRICTVFPPQRHLDCWCPGSFYRGEFCGGRHGYRVGLGIPYHLNGGKCDTSGRDQCDSVQLGRQVSTSEGC